MGKFKLCQRVISVEQDMKKLLDSQNKEQLVEFLMEYAKRDNKLENAINVRFAVPEYKAELVKYERMIDRTLDGVSDWSTHDSWGHVHINTGDLITEIYERLEQGYVRLAFDETELLYRKLLENFEYQGECEIADEAEYCLQILGEVSDKATLETDKEYMFKRCIELAELEDGKDYGADYEDKLLGIAAKFVSVSNWPELDTALVKYETHRWRAENFKLIRLNIIEKLQGKASAEAFIAENLTFPKIREIDYGNAMSAKNYEQSEQL